jgi:hypothetical protein
VEARSHSVLRIYWGGMAKIAVRRAELGDVKSASGVVRRSIQKLLVADCCLFALLALVAAAGCESTTEPPESVEPGILTDGDGFEITSYCCPITGQPAYQVEIPYTFTNRTGQPVYLSNCHGEFDLELERKVGNGWVSAWSNVHDTCLSPPIVIEAGAVYSTTQDVWGWAPGETSIEPEFDAHAGTHRIHWIAGVTSYQENPYPSGDPIPLEDRLSNEFELTFAVGATP